jgi:metallo-beta-lactamase class B
MKRIWFLLLSLFVALQVSSQSNDEIHITKDVQLIHLKDSVFVHVSWEDSQQFGRFPSNGMILIRDGQAIMVDTPMDNEKTAKIVEYLQDSMQVETIKLIIGHYHDDCMGGLEYIQSKGIESLANSMTIEKCKELDLPVPSQSFTDSLTFDFNGEPIVCRFFGAGHTIDNITVWLPNEKILFGGCLIKSARSKGLGNIKEAVIPEWDLTILKLQAKYPDIETVIPGHGNFGGPELLKHTIGLVAQRKQ